VNLNIAKVNGIEQCVDYITTDMLNF